MSLITVLTAKDSFSTVGSSPPNIDNGCLHWTKVFLVELQRRYDNIPAVIIEDTELRDVFVPLRRADFEMVERYRCAKRTSLLCPVVAFGGEADSRASQAELITWKDLTQGDFDLHL